MAKTKSKNDIKVTINKKSNAAVKKRGLNKKNTQLKKKLEIVDEIKNVDIKEAQIVKKNNQNKKSLQFTEVKELTQDEIIAQRKERNRRKYQNYQKKYQDNKKAKDKKKIVIEEAIAEKIDKNDSINEEDLIKKVKENEDLSKTRELRKEKRKVNKKSIQFTQTITSIKESVNDKNIPSGQTKEEKVKRSRRYIKESIVYAILLSIIDVICILVFDEFNFLRLFDVKALNIVVTIVIALIFNFFVAYMVDYFVTIVWLKKKNRKKVGEQDGDNWTIKGEYRENFIDKEGK